MRDESSDAKDSPMTAFEILSSMAEAVHRRAKTAIFKVSAASTRHTSFAMSVAAQALGILVLAAPGHAQTLPPSSAVNAPAARQGAEPAERIDAGTSSCKELKSRLQGSGTLAIVSGPGGGGGDTYYARVPQCEFWLRPQFSYVTAKDGWCGVGYVCAAKLQGR